MAMDALGAMRLYDERQKGAWQSMQEGLKSLGNLDTYMKDRSLTEGREPAGVFGGWKAMRDPAKVEAEEAAEAEESASAKKPLSLFGQRKPELADIHRWAMLRGLNHDQATIDEKTGRPERDRQYGLAVSKQDYDTQKEIAHTLAGSQDHLRQRQTGNQMALAQLYGQLSAATDEETRNAIKDAINEVKSQKLGDIGTLENVENLMDNYNVPDYYPRYKRGDMAGAENPGAADADERMIEHARHAKAFMNGAHTFPSKADVLEYAQKNNLDLTMFNKSIKEEIGTNWDNYRRNQEQQENALNMAGKSTSNKGGSISTVLSEAGLQETIKQIDNLKSNLNAFINDPTFENYQMVASSIKNNTSEEVSDYSKLPVVGSLFGLFQESKTMQEFQKDKNTLARKARDKLSEATAKLNSLNKGQKGLPKGEADL